MKTRTRRTPQVPTLVGLVLLLVLTPAALSASADLDATFDGDGFALVDFGGTDDQANGVALQADGKIVVAGGRNVDATNFDPDEVALARLDADGSLDPTFGDDGRVLTDLSPFRDEARAVAVQADGRIVVAGAIGGGLFVARYTADGELDPTFGAGGVAVRPGAGFASALALLPNGSILAAGGTGSAFLLSRFTPAGALDPTFGTGGSVVTPLGGSVAHALALHGDGRIVLAGAAGCSPTCSDFALARYELDGAPDLSFGDGGTVVTDLGSSFDHATALAVDPDGRIVTVGSAGGDVTGVVVYRTDGRLDAGFGSAGIRTLQGFGQALVLRQDGRILVGATFDRNFVLTQLHRDGTRDDTFSGDGTSSADLGADEGLSDLALLPDGRVVAAGLSVPTGSSSPCACDFVVARYLEAGAPPQPAPQPAPPEIQPPPQVVTPPPLPVAQPPAAPVTRSCLVPTLRGKWLESARAALRKAGCRAGRVTRVASATVRAGRVLRQSPRAGTRLGAGGAVSLVVSRGRGSRG